MTKVKNINGTSDNNCKCGSWLQHWKKYSKQDVDSCSEKSCSEKKDLVGAHVQKSDSSDMSWYIIPLCKTHNKSTDDLEITTSRKLVSANKKETCEK
ncbi:hypothetical protein B0A78_12095 [Flavobacterium columnare NBRC 100251 = ATCC 23463]|uniref:Uncharacterized protein n=2 Tax=Flavobacterium columnare TaxID=996 RepID=G8XA11_FLACA|nr:hypothetical protein [Flavobacterium columnare]AEW85175.1 hypothetical protein FCOL_01630 [Flavobacterium columnare ATCC 49512]AMO19548.1 hypothetical protein UN65_03595 [Flavobacterium columnare]ANO49049.1 hypothetical protein Pf1_00801 [Flavobacterium columnare]APT22947.1 hypothetical protein BU993_10170 [Flavobacterium columnare]AUX17487.1 hypothetical protein AQ623_03695 [Flavobacterium columnare]